jgi:hypothetical protein
VCVCVCVCLFNIFLIVFTAFRVAHSSLFVPRMMSDYKVDMVNDSINEFYVEFTGPKDSKCLASFLTLSLFQLHYPPLICDQSSVM